MSALDLIGRTPIVELRNLWKGPGRILAKAEFLQPGGSVKDRSARAIVDAARADGRLKPGAPVVEMTSGNMGAGLARALVIRSSLLCLLATVASPSGYLNHLALNWFSCRESMAHLGR